MSEEEIHVGILTELIPIEGETIQDIARRLLTSSQLKETESLYDGNTVFCLCDAFFEEYVNFNNKLYKVTKKNEDTEGDIFEAYPNPDGSINFVVKYYNGSCSLEEALENALKK